MAIRSFAEADTDAVVQLWEDCGLTRPWNDPRKDIARKLEVQRDLFLVLEEDARIAGSAMVGFDGHRGWVYYLAVDPGFRGRGFGRALMQRAEQLLIELGCPKFNLQVRVGNEAVLAFYRSLGYVEDPVASMSKRLIPDD
ncbi:MAG: family acetyltransferase [Rhodoglobus sp.]|jgi:ribosomal protein S18 acetylase RimI-like enzyme|nr:family acetyltransferase [Rhodoglobus sp.]